LAGKMEEATPEESDEIEDSERRSSGSTRRRAWASEGREDRRAEGDEVDGR